MDEAMNQRSSISPVVHVKFLSNPAGFNHPPTTDVFVTPDNQDQDISVSSFADTVVITHSPVPSVLTREANRGAERYLGCPLHPTSEQTQQHVDHIIRSQHSRFSRKIRRFTLYNCVINWAIILVVFVSLAVAFMSTFKLGLKINSRISFWIKLSYILLCLTIVYCFSDLIAGATKLNPNSRVYEVELLLTGITGTPFFFTFVEMLVLAAMYYTSQYKGLNDAGNFPSSSLKSPHFFFSHFPDCELLIYLGSFIVRIFLYIIGCCFALDLGDEFERRVRKRPIMSYRV